MSRTIRVEQFGEPEVMKLVEDKSEIGGQMSEAGLVARN
jgi:hypothetical protein